MSVFGRVGLVSQVSHQVSLVWQASRCTGYVSHWQIHWQVPGRPGERGFVGV